MFKKIIKIALIIVFIVLIVASIFIICWSVGKGNNYSNDYFTGIATIVAALIAVIGVSNSIKSSDENKRKELLDNLDSKSEWRKQLYNVASKTFIDTDDVFRVLASLRYFPHEEYKDDESNDERYFIEATQTIYSDLYSIIETHKGEINDNIKNSKCDDIKVPILFFEESEKVRVYTKYLLKHHWEYNNDKKAFIPDKEMDVWNKTKTLIGDINYNQKAYFTHVTKFKYANKTINSHCSCLNRICNYLKKKFK
ncbi:hypothetical protein [Mammaliicoccus sciuri]|uniref:hypothetical protein n=1 Tax=Mammaliicoccus sciuri TaxID=1296 RepID=UPI0019502C0D|nr:hypothetical protein [Mammaliicoccus sciuri]